MLRVNQLAGFGARRGGGSALAILQSLGLAGGLKLCLDAGDLASYPSGQVWLDLSGNGSDFNRGDNASGEASDPTFNGTAGRLSGGEYWSFDGGDWFTYDSANEAWMQNLHKDGALFSVLQWVFYPTVTAAFSSLWGTNGGTGATGTGAHSILGNNTGAGIIFLRAANGGVNVVDRQSSTALAIQNRWNLIGMTVNEAANAMAFFANDKTDLTTCTYSSPSAGNASQILSIGSRGNGNTPLANNSRLGMTLFWEGAALTAGQVAAFHQATRGRYGV